MKVNRLLMGLFTCVAVGACSSDDAVVSGEDTSKVFSGDEAYMTVYLSDAGGFTRAADGGLQYGSEKEYKVSNAHFYFYDAGGNFMTQASVWNGGNAVSGDPVNNIEFEGNTVVVLRGLSGKAYPKYMVTVLNQPRDFQYGESLREMEDKLASNATSGIYDDTNNFTMSTTSYTGEGRDEYFVTEVNADNFKKEQPTKETIGDDAVTVYVERLASKVTLTTNLEGGNNGVYKLADVTIAGELNEEEDTEPEIPSGDEQIYVKFLGWRLNATAKRSLIVKNINAAWTNDNSSIGANWTWNDAGNYRSYWGKSYNYGQGTYPKNNENKYKEGSPEANGLSDYLDYVGLMEDNLTTIGESAYCPENTNTSEIVSDNFPSAVTGILLKAQLCNAKGEALDLVRFNGMLFKKDQFLKYILNGLKQTGKLTYWCQVEGDGETSHRLINEEDVELTSKGDGKVAVSVKDDVTLYNQQVSADGTSYTSVSEEDLATFNKNLDEVSDGAMAYTNGMMYYNIPIEHLNNTKVTESEEKTIIPEAKYGVVRNHYYVVTVNKVEKLGKGIFDDEEVIVPSVDDQTTYYVGAKINILSWKVVNQSVDL